MDLDAIRHSPIGRLVPISGTDGATGRHFEHAAYVPDPLPDDVALSSATWTRVAAAEAALGRLDQAAGHIPDPALLQRPALRREAQSTSALEGTFAPLAAVMASEPEERGGLSPDVREVLNYVVAAEEGFAWVRERPITRNLLEALQQTLVADTPSEHHDAGRVRQRQVVIGARGAMIEHSRFVPPPAGDQLEAGLDAWLAWLRDPPPDLAPIVRAAMAHYQFETLHPFSDGNGRIGRLVIVMQMLRDVVLREPILVVSPWFEARRDAYQHGLLALSQTGDWDRWIGFFAAGVEASADTTRQRIESLLAWREQTLLAVRAAGLSGVAERVAEELVSGPIVRAPMVARRYGISPQGAMVALRRLAELGVLHEQRVRGRVTFVARDAYALLQA